MCLNWWCPYSLNWCGKRNHAHTLREKEASSSSPTTTTPTERDPLHQGLIVKRSNLRSRNYDLQLDAKLGKTQIVSAHAGLSHQAGYYCNVCDCVLKDNQSWLDHINGKYHNRALGMNMVAERVTVDTVRDDDGLMQNVREKTHSYCCVCLVLRLYSPPSQPTIPYPL